MLTIYTAEYKMLKICRSDGQNQPKEQNMISHENWKRNWVKNREEKENLFAKSHSFEKRKRIFFQISNFERRMRIGSSKSWQSRTSWEMKIQFSSSRYKKMRISPMPDIYFRSLASLAFRMYVWIILVYIIIVIVLTQYINVTKVCRRAQYAPQIHSSKCSVGPQYIE